MWHSGEDGYVSCGSGEDGYVSCGIVATRYIPVLGMYRVA